MQRAYINAIGTAVPPHDIHGPFVAYVPTLLPNEKSRRLFAKMSERSGIEHRYSFLEPEVGPTKLDRLGFYRPGAFPDTETRMRFFAAHAFGLAEAALADLGLPERKDRVTHVIVVSCTGFYAPGLDLDIVAHFGLDPNVERTFVGFMGCNAAFNALKLARHIVRSEPHAKVLVLTVELCTLHFQETAEIDQSLCFLLFADGAAAAIVSAEPVGIAMDAFGAAVLPDSAGEITWHIGRLGFDMRLSGRVPGTIARGLPAAVGPILDGHAVDDVGMWAVHPGGRTILDAVGHALRLKQGDLQESREVLRRFGNMSSATIMFVLKEMLGRNAAAPGVAMAFGPGLSAELMRFETTG